ATRASFQPKICRFYRCHPWACPLASLKHPAALKSDAIDRLGTLLALGTFQAMHNATTDHASNATSLSMYLSEINHYPLLTADQEKKLARRYIKGDAQSGHTLVTSNLRFVVKVAYEYRSYGIKMSDLIQEGNIGLMKAVQKFDPDKGIRLIS